MPPKDPMEQFDVSPETGKKPYSRMLTQAKERGLPTPRGSAPPDVQRGGTGRGALNRAAKAEPFMPGYEKRIEDLKAMGAPWPMLDRAYRHVFELLGARDDQKELARMADKRAEDYRAFQFIG